MSGYVHRGLVKDTEHAFNKTSTYKRSSRTTCSTRSKVFGSGINKATGRTTSSTRSAMASPSRLEIVKGSNASSMLLVIFGADLRHARALTQAPRPSGSSTKRSRRPVASRIARSVAAFTWLWNV